MCLRRRPSGVWVLALAAGWFSPPAARAQTVEAGREAFAQADFETSIRAFETVLASPSLDRATAVEAHRYLCALRVLEGRTDPAREHARVAVALDPSITSPDGAPDEVGLLLDEARAEMSGARAELTIEPRAPPETGTEVQIAARVEPSPAWLASELSLACDAGAGELSARGPPPEVSLRLTPGPSPVECRAGARTSGGAVLLSLERAFEAEEVGGDDSAVWIAVGIVAGVLAVTAVSVGVGVATSEQPSMALLGEYRVIGWP